MSIAGDIVTGWHAPGAALARQRAGGERRAFVLLMAGAVLMFAAQVPLALRGAAEDPAIPFEARLAGALFGWLFLFPVLAYGLAALSHLAARALGGRGSFAGARRALFFAVLAAAPLWMLNGLAAGWAGPGPVFALTQIAALAGFLALWIAGLVHEERAT